MNDEITAKQLDKSEVAPASIWTKNFILLCLSNLCLFISIQMLLPTLPIYILKIGSTQSDVGYVMGFFVIGSVLMRIFSGWLVDHFSRKRLMTIGLSAMFGVTLLYIVSINLSFLILTRALHGLALGLSSTTISTMVVDSLPPERMGEGIGYFGLTSTISMAIAPMIGLWLFSYISYFILFLAVTILAFLALLFSFPITKANTQVNKQTYSVSDIFKNLFEKTAILPSILGFLMALVYSAVLYFIALYGTDIGIVNPGLFFAAIAIAMFVSRPVSGRWTDRGATKYVLLISFIIILASIILICNTNNIIEFLIAGVLNGFGFGSCLPTLQAMAVRHAPAQRRGAATATYFIGYELGLGIGAIILGYVAKLYGYQIMFLITIIPLVLAGVTFYIFGRQKS